MDHPLDEATFDRAADETLNALELALNELEDVEADLASGILTVEFSDGVKYLVNSHRAARQIWMAAERSAWHFDLGEDGRWIATKSGEELWRALSLVMGRKLGRAVRLGGR